MKNKLILIFALQLISFSSFPQSGIDRLMTERVPNCEDITLNCNRLIMNYYAKQDYDSAFIILDYWYTKCGMIEPVVRTMILFGIRDKNFTESVYDSTIIFNIIDYQNSSNVRWAGYYPILKTIDEYFKFTKDLATNLLPLQKANSLELLYCKLYANQGCDFFKEIQKEGLYDNTAVKPYYYRQVKKLTDVPDMHFSMMFGSWMPQGHAALLGNHPMVGVQFGGRFRKMTYDLSMAVRFNNSKNDYQILYKGAIDTTNYFSSGYFGADIERNLLRIKNIQVDLLGGIAYDVIDAVNTTVNNNNNNTNKIDPHSMNSLNINLGLGYRYIIAHNNYIAVQAKCHFVNYNNKGGTNLSGNCFTVALVYGGFLNNYKRYRLETLRYRD